MKGKIISDLKEKYFSTPNQQVTLKKGQVLMDQNEPNDKLFLVLDGLVAGLLHGDGETIEIFRSSEDMLVGFHSFFSRSFYAYAEVKALEDTKLAYLSYKEDKVRPAEFLEDFLPVIVDELFERQVFAKKLMIEKESCLIQNLHRDKLATLGQMAAGIAHELNNAVGIITGNSEWLAKDVYSYIKKHEQPKVFSFFEKGYEKGQYLSSMEVRKKRQLIEKKLNVPMATAKKLARIGFNEENIKSLKTDKQIDELVEQMHHFWEIGVAIHDMLLASKHASNVIASVKSLGISDREQMDVDINSTLKSAITLVKKISTGIKIVLDKQEVPIIKANDTELVQVWVNLIKNACESLKHAKTPNPKITIKSKSENNYVHVSITDNGPGIPDNLKDKIFQPDFTTKKGGLSFGLGLGLPVVQKHINQNKGTIEVESEPGKTTFCIKLPIE